MNVLNCQKHLCLTCAFKQLTLIIICNTLSQAYLTPKTSASPQIVTTMTPTVSDPHQHVCYDDRCKCNSGMLECVMNGVYLLIFNDTANYARLSITCDANTSAEDIQQAQFPYHFQKNEAQFELENCAILPEILRRPNISYTGTVIFNNGVPVPARFLHDAVGLERLTFYLKVNSSAAVVLPAQLLHNQSSLKQFRLELIGDTGEVTFSPQIFHTLYGLEVLSVRVNRLLLDECYTLRNLTEAHFRDTSNLRKLRLENRYMQTLSSDLFATLSELNELFLRGNKLVALQSGLLHAQGKLMSLDLSFNNLQTLPPGIFDTTPYLWKLDLRYNQFSVPTEIIAAVQPLSFLYRLDLRHNHFTHIAGAGKFENHTLLTRPHFGEISAAPSYFKEYVERWTNQAYPYNKTVINLSYNHIDTFSLREIIAAGLRCPYKIDFISNRIKNVNAICHQSHSEDLCMGEIFLQDNPLQCDCFLPWDYSTEYPIRKCVERIAGNLSYMCENRTMCAWKPKFCPTACNCRYDAQTLHVNCTHAMLESLTEIPRPEQVSLTQSTLDITHNNFFELPTNVTFGYANVTRLYAAHNRLENLHKSHLPPLLEVLDVRNNRLERLSNSFIQYYLNESDTLQQLYLSGNRWLCDCDAELLLIAVRTHQSRIPDVAQLICANRQNNSLLQARYSDICVSESEQRERLLWSLLSIALVIIVFISLAALYYKYNLELNVWLYARNLCLCCVREHDLDKEKTFDAFISYAHQDAHFVNDILVPGLEQGEPKFRVCTHERNWLAGAYIPEQIIESVDQSRRTIIVLSQHFVESDWARMEFRTAHQCALNERRSRIIIIKYGELTDLTKLDKELRAYLTMNTYLEWADHPSFWSKLRYAMPHRKGEVRNAGMLELNERQRVYVIGDVERNGFRQRDE